MLLFRDWLLLLVNLLAILAGIVWPEYGKPFQPYPMYCMMALLFFSFLPIRLGTIFRSMQSSLPTLFCGVLIKLVLLPLLVFICFRCALPKYAVAALLLTGISTGVSSPFFAALMEANLSIVFAMVVVSSLLVPFTLPALTHVLLGKSVEIPIAAMARLLGLIIFCPLVLAEALKRISPAFTAKLSKAQYCISLTAFAVTNVGVFSRYSAFLREEPSTVFISLGVAAILAAAYFVAGMLFSLGRPLPDHLSLIISFGLINNILGLVLSAKFFGHLEATVAAMYTIPFFGLLVPMRLYRNYTRMRMRNMSSV